MYTLVPSQLFWKKHRKIAAGERERVKPAARFPTLTRYRVFLKI